MYLKEYTLNKDSFLAIHNTLCELQWHEDDAVKTAVETIRKSLKPLYQQEDTAFKTKMDYYDRVKTTLGLTTIWSLYEVDHMSDEHPYQGATTVVYKDHWGGETVSKDIAGTNWSALYEASDAAIRDSGDRHHRFIEAFYRVGDKLYLTTGS